MYVVSIGQGKVYRILPSVVTSDARNIQCGEHQEQPIANFTDKNVIDNKEKIIYEQSNQELQSIPANDNSDMEINVSIEPLKDPVARGESQAITITVTDSTIRPVANARISGVLLYPGDNFERIRRNNGYPGEVCLFMDYWK
jgi:hypothetical protein